MKKYTSLLLLFSVVAVHGQNEVKERYRKQIDEASAMRMFQTLEGAKIVAFSKDHLIKGGLEDKDLRSWTDLTNSSNEYVQKQIEIGNLPSHYTRGLESLAHVFDFLKENIVDLHQKFGDSIVKDGARYRAKVSAEQLNDAEKERIKRIKEKAVLIKKEIASLSGGLFQAIEKNTPIPTSWSSSLYEKGKIKNASAILKNYEKVIADFNTISRDQFVQTYQLNQKMKPLELIDKLEKVAFIMGEKQKTKPTQEREAQRSDIFKIIAFIKDRNPDLMSSLQQHKFGATEDKGTIILFAQAGAYEAVLSQFIRELEQLLAA